MSAVILSSDGFEYNGFRGLALKLRRRIKSPQYGLGYELVFEGLPEAINAAFDSLADDQDAVVEEGGPFWRMTVRTPDDPTQASSSVYSNTYELLGNSLQKDIREHPIALALGQDKMDKIEKYLAQTSTPPTAATLTTEIGAVGTNARWLYNYMRQRNGSAAYQVSQYVFRVTAIVSRRSDYAIAYSSVNRIYSLSTMITETLASSPYVISLQNVQTQFVNAQSVSSGFAWGWLKQAPSVTTAAGNRIAIQLEYWLEQWDTTLYGALI